jgi:hypothetical protein
MKQLDANLAALDLPLSRDHIERLDKLSEPKLNLPAQVLKIAPNLSNAGAMVNGMESTLMPLLQRTSKTITSLRSASGPATEGSVAIQRVGT